MADSLQDLWDEEKSQASTGSPAGGTEGVLPPSPSPSGPDPIAEMRNRIDYLSNLVQSLATGMASRGPTPTEQVEAAHGAVVPEWKDQSVMTEGDVAALLDGKDPAGVFNRAINSAIRPVYDQFGNVIKERDARIKELEGGIQRYVVENEGRRRMEEGWGHFYGRHPKLRSLSNLVEQEFMAMAQEYQAAPYRFAGQSREAMHDYLAGRVSVRARSIAKAIGATPSAEGEPVQQQALPATATREPARGTFMERGSGTRVATKQVKQGPEQKEMSDMHDFVKSGRAARVG